LTRRKAETKRKLNEKGAWNGVPRHFPHYSMKNSVYDINYDRQRVFFSFFCIVMLGFIFDLIIYFLKRNILHKNIYYRVYNNNISQGLILFYLKFTL